MNRKTLLKIWNNVNLAMVQNPLGKNVFGFSVKFDLK